MVPLYVPGCNFHGYFVGLSNGAVGGLVSLFGGISITVLLSHFHPDHMIHGLTYRVSCCIICLSCISCISCMSSMSCMSKYISDGLSVNKKNQATFLSA